MVTLLKSYAVFSVALGICQVVDGAFLTQAPPGCVSGAFASLEAAWVIVSVVALALCVRHRASWLAPLSYLVYNALGWSYGLYLLFTRGLSGSLVIPLWAAIAGAVFGFYYAVTSTLLFLSLRRPEQQAARSGRQRA